jgi:hypothetical protein
MLALCSSRLATSSPETVLASDLERLRGIHRRMGGEARYVVSVNFTRALRRKGIADHAEDGVVHRCGACS